MTYLRTLALTLALVLGSYVALEVAVDEFGVFGSAPPEVTACMPNARAVKLRHLVADRVPDTFVLGSSRANAYRVATLERLTPGRAYNLSAPMENALGMQRWVRWLVVDRDAREAVLALDFDLQEHPYNPSDPFVRDPPELTGEARAAFALRYALTPPDQLRACLSARWRGSPYRFDPATGEDVNRATRALSRPPGQLLRFDADRANPTADRLAATVAALRADGTHVTVIINPVWAERFRLYRPAVYARWLRNVVRASGGVWDFSGVNPVTERIANYYDDVHFTREVGDRVLETVYGGRGTPGFGVYVDESNVERRIDELRRELARPAPS